MARSPLTKLELALGRLLGASRRKEPDILQTWIDWVASQGWKATDRMIDLIKYDLQTQGINVSELVAQLPSRAKSTVNEEALRRTQELNAIQQLTQQLIQERMQHAEEVSAIIDSFKRKELQRRQLDEMLSKSEKKK